MSSWLELPEVVAARRRTLRVLVVAQVLGSLGIGAGPSIGVLLAQEVTRSETWAGVARASTTIGAALLAIPLGALAARQGRRRALSLAWFAAGGGAALLVGSVTGSSTALLVLGMLLLGAGSAAGLQARFAATDLALPDHRARSLSLVVWVGTFGAVLGPNLGLPGAAVERGLGLPALSGAFAIGAVLLVLTGLVVTVALRPDPLHVARGREPVTGPRMRLGPALAEVRRSPRAGFALLALVLAHVSMVSVMTMTPVHLAHQGHGITVVGLTISLHVLGMFALAPLVGAAADRWGRVPVVLAGQVVLLAAAATAVLGAASTTAVVVGLFLLGLGWSVVTVPASALLTQSVPPASRPYVQGAGDASMNAAAALGAVASGPLLATAGYAGLGLVSGLVVLPVLWAARRLHRGAVSTSITAVEASRGTGER